MDTRAYFAHAYPYEALQAFLTLRGDKFCDREFAIEGEWFRRYVVAHNAQDLKRQVLAMPDVKSVHIGPIYSDGVARAREGGSHPVRREFVIDIDLTDLPHLKLVGRDGRLDVDACDRAWPVCALALFFAKRILREAFGFEQFAVIYSGRRGAHLHVLDERAMRLDDEGRTAVACYANASLAKGENLANDTLMTIVERHDLGDATTFAFEEVLVGKMGLLDDGDARLGLVESLTGMTMASVDGALDGLDEEVLQARDGVDAYAQIKKRVNAATVAWPRQQLEKAVVALVWPRIDYNVSCKRNHLLKAPFVAHPKTGRIAVALDPEDYFKFRPSEAPSIADLHADALKHSIRFLLPKPKPKSRPVSGLHDIEDLVVDRASSRKRKARRARRQSPLVPEAHRVDQ